MKLSLDKLKSNFDTNGYVVIDKFFSQSKIKEIRKKILNYLDKNKKKLSQRKIHYAKNSKLINSAHHLKMPFINRLKKNAKIESVVEVLLDAKIKDFGSEVFAKPAKVGMAVPIHQDNYYWNINNSKGLTVWIALNRSSKKNGAIFYFNKTHTLGLLKHKSSFVPGSSQEIAKKNILKKFKKITPSLKEGDILIHHCLVVHGSKKNLSNQSRIGLTLRYIGKYSKINKVAKKNYEKKLFKQLN